jgi:uncharacterized delta-60 repeat protein
VALLLAIPMMATPLARSAPAEDAWHLDDDFGTEGEVVTSFGGGFDEAFDVAMQGDGKIVVAGEATDPGTGITGVGVVRYTEDGGLDPTFGNGGKVFTSFNIAGLGEALAIQPDGKIVVAGSLGDSSDSQGKPGMMVLRYTSDGNLDGSFGIAGRYFQRFGNISRARGVAVYPSSSPNAGKVVVAGFISDESKQTHEFLVLRLLANGNLDPSFGPSGGAYEPDPGLGEDEANAVAILPDGRIVLAGYGQRSQGTQAEAVVLGVNGSPDTSFGPAHDGWFIDNPETNSVAWAVTADPSDPGAFIVAGKTGGTTFSTGSDMAAWRFKGNSGDPQHAFVDYYQRNDEARQVLVQPDGKVVLVGWAAETGTGDSLNDLVFFALARLTVAFQADPTFGDDATFGQGSHKVVAGFAFGYDAALGGALQRDGDIVAAGGTNQAPPSASGQLDFGVARFTGPGGPTKAISTKVLPLRDFELDIKPETLQVGWAESAGSDVKYDVRMQSARFFREAFGPWRTLLSKTRKRSTEVGLNVGETVCFQARAHSGGQTSKWSESECTSTPVDDKTLGDPAKDWYRYGPSRAPNYYNHTGSGTLITGAELHLDRAWFAQLAILYTECKHCGKFKVLIDNDEVFVVDSANTKDIAKQFIYVRDRKTPSLHDVTIRVIKPGSRGVYIDGIGVSLAPSNQ